MEQSEAQGFHLLLALAGYAGIKSMEMAQQQILVTISRNKNSEYPDWFDKYACVLHTFHLAEQDRQAWRTFLNSRRSNLRDNPGMSTTTIHRERAKCLEIRWRHINAVDNFNKSILESDCFFLKVFEYLGFHCRTTVHPSILCQRKPFKLHFQNWEVYGMTLLGSLDSSCRSDRVDGRSQPLLMVMHDPKIR
jgi:hypothetical protein